jgi:hypothetical protein
MSRCVRPLQVCTAAAALFAVLGACGLPAPVRRPPVIVRVRPPRTEVTIRSLTGTWVALRPTPDGQDQLTIVLIQRGDTLSGTLVIDGRALASDPAVPARLDVRGGFVLGLGQTNERVVLRGRPDPTSDRIAASISGLSPQPVAVTFRRQ